MFTCKKMNPVKLLHVIGDSRFGGAGRIILRLGQVAQAEGWDVDILTTDPVFQQAVRQHGLGLANLDVVRRHDTSAMGSGRYGPPPQLPAA